MPTFRPPNRTVVFALPWHVTPPSRGVEAQAVSTARRLAAAGARVEIWATTACPTEDGLDVHERGFEPGDSIEDGLPVRRFPAVPRDPRAFARLRARIHRGPTLEPREEAAYFRNGFWSEGMRRAIHHRRHEMLYLFAPCFAATTVFGLPAAPQESILMPFLRDEGQAQLRRVWETIGACHHLLFNCESERAVVGRLWDLRSKTCLAAAAIDGPDRPPPPEFPPPAPVREPYVLFLGRQGEGHGTPELIECFRRLAGDCPLPFQLVLAGSGTAKIPPDCAGRIVNLGRVEERTKWALLANALCFVLPSARETLSFSLLESWLAGRPAIIHGRGSVGAALARHSGGGLVYRTCPELRHVLQTLARNPDLANALGERGKAYVQDRFHASHATERLIGFLRDIEQWLAEADLAA